MDDKRIHRVLWAVVESYITNPDPVGSRFVTKKYAFNLSPATIRNIMADLEEMGFLLQPHTSAGRIPTDKGYRYYVDTLVQDEPGTDTALSRELGTRLENIRNDINSLLMETTKTLSSLSHYLAFALPPKPDKSTFRKINLFRHRKDQVAIVLLTNEGVIKNKIIQVNSDISQRDLARIAEYLNSEFANHTIDEIRTKLLKEMYRDKALCDALIAKAMEICQEAVSFNPDELFISGLSEVLGLPDFLDLDRIREVFHAIEDKHLIIKILDMLSETEGVRVLIGSENPAEELRKMSMVVSTYKEGDKTMGTVGIIGPTRMDYSKAITIVDTTAKFISRILTER